MKLRIKLEPKHTASAASIKEAAARKIEATETIEKAWERILSMKNSEPDQKRLLAVQEAMLEGTVGRDASAVSKRFSKAEALRIYSELAAIQKEGKLADLVVSLPSNYILVTSESQLREIVNVPHVVETNPLIAVDTETTGIDVYTDVIVGVSITLPHQDKHYYIPFKPTNDERALYATAIQILKPLMENERVGKVLHNAIFDKGMFERHGITLNNIVWDTMTAQHCLQENEPSYALKNLATKYLNEPSDTFAELFGKDAKFADIPLDIALAYAAKDTHLTWKLYEFQLEHLERMPEILEYYRRVEVPLISAVYAMERTGFVIDTEYARRYGNEMVLQIESRHTELMKQLLSEHTARRNVSDIGTGDTVLYTHYNKGELMAQVVSRKDSLVKIKAIEGATPFPTEQGIITVTIDEVVVLEKATDKPFNINSGQQLQPVLERLTGEKLPNLDAKQTLKPLAKKHKVIADLLAYRELTKLYSTYISVLPEKVHPKTGRLHARFNSIGTKTGRFSSGGNGVNLQNQPADARKLFVAPEGYCIIGADWSQQEVRCAAYFTQEPVLLDAYASGRDVYSSLASEFYNKPYDECGDGTKERKAMKVAVLAVLYGVGPSMMAQQLNCTVAEAKDFIAEFYRKMPYVQKWIEETKAFAKKNGFVYMDKKQRKRRLPDAMKRATGFDPEQQRALRQGPNASIQGTSAIQSKTTIVEAYEFCKRKGWYLWCTVHDELLVLAPIDFTPHDLAEFEAIMVNSYVFGNVPNRTDIEIMTRWGEGMSKDEWFAQQVA